MTKRKHAGGRPTLYRRELCERLVEAMAEGLSAEAAAAKIGISARSLFNWQHEHPEFLQAIQEGRQKALLWWEERALGMANGAPGNTQIVMLGLRNRSRAAHGWNNDTLKVEHASANGSPAQIETRHVIPAAQLSPEQRQQLSAILDAVDTDDDDS